MGRAQSAAPSAILYSRVRHRGEALLRGPFWVLSPCAVLKNFTLRNDGPRRY
jgi:hypothetical protein